MQSHDDRLDSARREAYRAVVGLAARYPDLSAEVLADDVLVNVRGQACDARQALRVAAELAATDVGGMTAWGAATETYAPWFVEAVRQYVEARQEHCRE